MACFNRQMMNPTHLNSSQKPYLILLCISPWMNMVIYRVQAEAWCPLEMAVYSTWGDHIGLVWVGMPYSK